MLLADPVETDDDHGVALVTSGARRSWLAWSDNLAVRTTPVPTGTADGEPDSEPVGVPRRLVEFAALLAQLGHDVALEVDDGTLRAHAEGTHLRTDRVDVELPDGVAFAPGPDDTVATVDAELLGAMLLQASHLPVGVEPDDPDLPGAQLTLAHHAVTIGIDWERVGVAGVELSVVADGHGPGAVTTVPMALLAKVVRHADPAEPLTLWVTRRGNRLGVAGADWTAVVVTRPTGLAAVAAGVAAELAGLADTLQVVRTGDAAWTISHGRSTVAVQVLDGPPPVVRATTPLVVDVAPTPDLLGELNAINAGLAGVRVWWRDGAVEAATDLAVDAAAEHLLTAIADLTTQVDQLGPLVASLGAAEV